MKFVQHRKTVASIFENVNDLFENVDINLPDESASEGAPIYPDILAISNLDEKYDRKGHVSTLEYDTKGEIICKSVYDTKGDEDSKSVYDTEDGEDSKSVYDTKDDLENYIAVSSDSSNVRSSSEEEDADQLVYNCDEDKLAYNIPDNLHMTNINSIINDIVVDTIKQNDAIPFDLDMDLQSSLLLENEMKTVNDHYEKMATQVATSKKKETKQKKKKPKKKRTTNTIGNLDFCAECDPTNPNESNVSNSYTQPELCDLFDTALAGLINTWEKNSPHSGCTFCV